MKHSIRTHQLLRALRGQDDRAFARDQCITGASLLQVYLAVSVPEFIANETDISAKQRPYAALASNGDFEILHVPATAVFNEPTRSEAKPIIAAPTTPQATAAHQASDTWSSESYCRTRT